MLWREAGIAGQYRGHAVYVVFACGAGSHICLVVCRKLLLPLVATLLLLWWCCGQRSVTHSPVFSRTAHKRPLSFVASLVSFANL